MTLRYFRSFSRSTCRAFLLTGALLTGGCAGGGVTQAATDTDPVMPNSTLGDYLAGQYAQASQDYTAAADLMSSALAADPQNPQLLEAVMKALVGAGQVDRAREIAGRLIDVQPDSPGAHVLLALGELKKGDYDGIEKRLAPLPAQGLNGFVLPLIRSWAAAGKGDSARAVALLAPVGAQKGFESVYELNVGLINDVAGHRPAAEEAYTKALQGSDTPPFRLVQIAGGFYERAGEGEKAQKLYRQFAEANEGSVLIEPIMDRIAAGRPAEPVIANPAEGVAESLFNLASALDQEHLNEAALLYTRLALDVRPDFAVAQILLGDVLVGEERYDEAIQAYGGVRQDSPFFWAAQLRIADTLGREGKVDQAVSEFNRLANERKDRADALIALGNLLRANERFPEAVTAYDEALKRIGTPAQRDWTVLYYRGVALQRSDQWKRAEQDFLKALELEPDQPHVLNYLAYSWVERGENFDRALEMLNKAVALRPEDGYIVDSLGWVLFRLGRYPEAVDQLERAIELKPNDPVINDHLGDAYWRVGRRHEARYQWQRALSFKPDADQVAPIQAKLHGGLGNMPSDS